MINAWLIIKEKWRFFVMTKKFKMKNFIFVALMLLLVGAVCFGAAQTEKKDVGQKSIAMLLQHRTFKRYPNADIPSFEQSAKNLGYVPLVHSAENDSERQIRQAESVLMQGVSAIILQPLNFKAANKIVEMAAEFGVPVISYNDIVLNSDIAGYVGRDSKKLGIDSARQMVKLYPEGNYVIVGGDEGAGVARDMVDGYLEVLKENPKISIVSNQFNRGWEAERGLRQVEAALIANRDNISAILANNDGLAHGSLQALRTNNLDGLVGLCGQDLELPAAQAIVEGKMSFTAFTEYAQMASDAVMLADAIINNQDLSKFRTIDNGFRNDIPWLETVVIFVTKDNMAEFLKEHPWWISVEDVYANVPKEEWPN